MSAFATAIWNTLSRHKLFTLNFAFKLFRVSIAVDNLTVEVKHIICNSLITICLPQAGEIWSKSDDPNYTKFWAFFFYKKPFHMLNILSKCKKSEKTSKCQFTRKRVKATLKKLLSTRKREKREKKWDFSLEKEWKKSESEHEWTPLKNVLSSV